MSFLQFASNNVKRNARAYSGYLLSSSFAVMIFFIYAMFYFHPDLASTPMGELTKVGMKAAEYVIFVVSFLFVLYSVSAFLKARKKEFGILSILGAADRQINSLIFVENMIIGFVSILLGIVGGMVFSKLFLLLGSRILEVKEMPFYLPWKAILLTLAAFFGLFLIISMFSVLMVRKNKVLELLQGTNKPKPEPKASVLLGLLSVSCLTAAVFLIQRDLSNANLIILLVLGLVGTYFFFTQLSVLIIRLLKKNRLFFWRGTNLIWVSEMAYKIKDNARMFFIVTVVTTVACSAVSIVLSLKQSNAERYLNTPYTVLYSPSAKTDSQEVLAKIEETLTQAHVEFAKVDEHRINPEFQEVKGFFQLINQTEYNALATQMKLDPVGPLNENEVVWFPPTQKYEGQQEVPPSPTLTSPDNSVSLTQVHVGKSKQAGQYDPLLVVNDSTWEKLRATDTRPNRQDLEIYYFVPAWNHNHVPSKSDQETIVSQSLQDWFDAKSEASHANGYVSIRASEFMQLKQTTSVMVFIGSFIAAVFSISTASFLYFKLFTDLNQDQASYRALSKIGLSPKEMQTASTIQIAALFFIPLVMAAVETLGALLSLKPHLSGLSIVIPTLMAIAAFFALQLVYFLVVRSRYLARLKHVMV